MRTKVTDYIVQHRICPSNENRWFCFIFTQYFQICS